MKINKILLLSAIPLLLAACDVSNRSKQKSSSELSSSLSVVPSSSTEESSEEISSSGLESSSEIISSSEEISSSIASEIPSLFLQKTVGKMEKMSPLGDFTPTLFAANSLKQESSRSLGDGVNHLTYSFNLNSGNKVTANVIEVDPSKAQIRSTRADRIETVNNQIVSFEENNPDIKVMAGVNADFFATGAGGSSVNAYVQDGRIDKAGHNDRGIYDYKNLDADIPASKPMLLGVSGDNVRIGPMDEEGTIKENIQAKFTYSVFVGKPYEEASPINLEGTLGINETKMGTNEAVIVTNGGKYRSSKGDILYRIKLQQRQGIFTFGKVMGFETCVGQNEGTATYFENGTICLIVSKSSSFTLEKGDYVGYCVTSPDDLWRGYDTVIGGRQSLVEDGKVASTVKLENSNGAQSTNIPRTCAGITPEGKVLITTIEALRYGGKSSSASDSYGVNLPELAEFMRAIGSYDALNFDGGGSTQLITSDNNGTGTKTLSVRSSDYGTYNVNAARKIFNTIIVTTK